ncbi:MAG: hypothetical protein KF768_01885 [Phycisphaeraceae bacterium]|nr:hypothetical protein [Phycisphaeraceae bacterium]
MPTEIDIAALWNFGDPAASERRFREALDGARAEGRTELKAELLTQLALAQGLAGRFDDAHRTLGEAAVALGESDCRGRVRLHLESGRLLNTSRAGDRGRTHFQAALSAAERLREDDLAVDAAHMLAIVAETGGSALA